MIMDAKQIATRLNKIKELPTLPVIAMEVNRKLDDQNVSIENLSKTIEKDQAITSKLLRLVNSSFFGVRSKVSKASDAVVLLGFDAVRNIVVSISIVKTLRQNCSENGLGMSRFWVHSVSTAMISKKISDMTGIEEPETCFTAGLLHDIGKIVMAQYFTGLFEQVTEALSEENVSFTEAEKKVTQIGHDKMGGFLAEKWKLPLTLVDAIKFHHNLSLRSTSINVVKIVHLADIISNTIPLSCEFVDEATSGQIDRKLHKNMGDAFAPHLKEIGYWYPGISENIKEACEFFLKE